MVHGVNDLDRCCPRVVSLRAVWMPRRTDCSHAVGTQEIQLPILEGGGGQRTCTHERRRQEGSCVVHVASFKLFDSIPTYGVDMSGTSSLGCNPRFFGGGIDCVPRVNLSRGSSTGTLGEWTAS